MRVQGDGMEPSRWERLSQIVDALVSTPPARREGLLNALCGTDAALRREALELVAELEAAPDFMATTPGELQLRRETAADPLIGTDIGPWRVLRPVAAGGMGAVYLAERADGGVKQTVALKLAYGGVDPEVQRRFRREQQILALLEHPNICRLIDGGVTADGRLYIAMPYLDGALPLTRYAAQRALPLPERLALLRTVCAAVQYAHQNLVVHGDLKPGNVLVTPEGVVQLVDFGVARLLDPSRGDGPLTATAAARPFTAEYASPEQLAGGAPTTLSDVYALGVMLFELCCGERPFGLPADKPVEALRLLAEREAPKPSTRCGEVWVEPPLRLRRLLAGDLDRIVQSAMAREPARRYDSAAALADDIDRHLRGLPVRAQAPTLGYQLGKLVRRHRYAVAGLAAGVVGLALFAGTMAATSVQLRERAEELRLARDRAEAVAAFWAELFREADPVKSTGGEEALSATELLDRGRESLRQRSAIGLGERLRLMTALSDAYWGLGEQHKALASAQEAVQLDDGRALPELMDAYRHLSNIHVTLLQVDEAQAAATRAEAIMQALPDVDPEARARVLNALALVADERGDLDAAVGYLDQAVAVQRDLDAADAEVELAVNLGNLGYMHFRRWRASGQPADAPELGRAIDIVREALGIQERLFGADNPRLVVLLNGMGRLQTERGDLQTAFDYYARARDIAVRDLPPSHEQAIYLTLNLADLRLSQDEHAAARALYEEALLAADGSYPAEHSMLMRARNGIARAQLAAGENLAAEASARAVLATLTAVAAASNRHERLWAQAVLADSLLAQGRRDAARRVLDLLGTEMSADTEPVEQLDAYYERLRRTVMDS
jgi:eukaryotic-like serine/threonine-protein kinase